MLSTCGTTTRGCSRSARLSEISMMEWAIPARERFDRWLGLLLTCLVSYGRIMRGTTAQTLPVAPRIISITLMMMMKRTTMAIFGMMKLHCVQNHVTKSAGHSSAQYHYTDDSDGAHANSGASAIHILFGPLYTLPRCSQT